MEEMLLHTENINEAIAEVEAAGGRVLLQLGHNLLVAKVHSRVAKQNSFSHSSAHISSSASASTLTHVNAYWMAREDELKPQPPVQKWTEKTAPMAFLREDSNKDVRGDSPYRLTMTGKIAVGVVVASGPGSLAISQTEYKKIVSECQVGLKFWSDQAAKKGVTFKLWFVLYSVRETISASNPTSCSSYEACHNVFVDASLQSLGFSTGQTGKDNFAQFLKDTAGADGAFLGFFSKYRQSHFAYAYFGGGPLYMQYSNDGWGSDQIDRVFAHEVGHVFNAPDEYAGCQCVELYGRGACTATNANCNNCTSSQGGCIMDSNDLGNLCESTEARRLVLLRDLQARNTSGLLYGLDLYILYINYSTL